MIFFCIFPVSCLLMVINFLLNISNKNLIKRFVYSKYSSLDLTFQLFVVFVLWVSKCSYFLKLVTLSPVELSNTASIKEICTGGNSDQGVWWPHVFCLLFYKAECGRCVWSAYKSSLNHLLCYFVIGRLLCCSNINRCLCRALLRFTRSFSQRIRITII